MGKKRSRKTYTSKGTGSNVSSATLKLVRRERSPFESALNKINAWRAGKNPWITVPGTQSNMRFIKVRANAVYGDPKFAAANLFRGRGDE